AEAPDRRVRRAAHALPPSRADGVGSQHRAPDRIARGLLVLVLAADLPVPACDEVEMRLRVERGTLCGIRHRRLRRERAVVRRREHDDLLDLVGVLRRVAARAWTAERPPDEIYALDAA